MILVDTYPLIIIGQGRRIAPLAEQALETAKQASELIAVSAATAWELCFLERLARTGPLLGQDGAAFFNLAVDRMELVVIPIDAPIAIEARRLPQPFHKDPADRFIVATARLRGLTLVTSDQAILDYAAQGHVDAIAC